MTSRSHLRALTRLAAVYKIVAHLDGMALDRANAAVREVELLLKVHALAETGTGTSS